MLSHTLLLLSLSVGSAFPLASNVQEAAGPKEQALPSVDDLKALVSLTSERLLLTNQLRARLLAQQDIARTIESEIRLKRHSFDFAYLRRIKEKEADAAAALAQLQRTTAQVMESKRQLNEAKRRGYQDAHSQMRMARGKLKEASALMVAHRVQLEQMNNALAEEKKLAPAERESRFESEVAEMRGQARTAKANAQSLELLLRSVEESVAGELSIFEAYKKSQEIVDESRTSKVDRGTVVLNDYLTARATSAARAQPLLVNFTAHVAINARMMETRVFQAPAVAPLLSDFVEARLHTDAADGALRRDIDRRVAEIAMTSAVPIYVVLDPRTGEELGRHMGSTADPAEFASFLKAAAERFDASSEPATDTQLWRRIFRLEDEIRAFSEPR